MPQPAISERNARVTEQVEHTPESTNETPEEIEGTEETGTEETALTSDQAIEALRNHEDQYVRTLFAEADKQLTRLHELLKEIDASQPPTAPQLDRILEDDNEDPQIKHYRDEIERLKNALAQTREEAHTYVKDTRFKVLPSDEITRRKNEFAKVSKTIDTQLLALRTMAKAMAENLPSLANIDTLLDAIELPTRRTITRSSTQAVRAPRPRLKSVDVTLKDGRHRTFDTLGRATQWTGHDTLEVFESYIASAGVSKWREVTEPQTIKHKDVTYVITPETENGNASDDDKDETENENTENE
jgi:hypothetical protein